MTTGTRLDCYHTERRHRFPKHRLHRPTTPLFIHPTTAKRVTARQVQYLMDRLYRQAGLRSHIPQGAWSMRSATPSPWTC